MPESLGARVLKRVKGSKKKNEGVHFIQESGKTYASKSGGSDMTLRDRPDPHAFIQFNPVVIL